MLFIFHDVCIFFFKQKTAYEMRISDWSSDVCSSDLRAEGQQDVVMVRHAGLQPARVLSAHPDDCSSAFGHAVGQPFADASAKPGEIGRASCRERVCQYV